LLSQLKNKFDLENVLPYFYGKKLLILKNIKISAAFTVIYFYLAISPKTLSKF
jgi:hypothetical protein